MGLAAHTNLRDPEVNPFKPLEGRLVEPSVDNVRAARDETLRVSLPWLVDVCETAARRTMLTQLLEPQSTMLYMTRLMKEMPQTPKISSGELSWCQNLRAGSTHKLLSSFLQKCEEATTSSAAI